jgi:hypothetical protein
MHAYATDSAERKYIPLLLAGLAIGAALGFPWFLSIAHVAVPWWLDAPSTMGFYGFFYWLFDTQLWRIRALHRLGVVKVPVLQGDWRGYVTSSFDEHAERHVVEVQIVQSWARLKVTLRSESSKSHSYLATLLTDAPDGAVLSYQYQNEPMPQAKETMQIHHGTARLVLSDDGTLTGNYYTGRGRQSVGSIYLERFRAKQ